VPRYIDPETIRKMYSEEYLKEVEESIILNEEEQKVGHVIYRRRANYSLPIPFVNINNDN